MLIPIYWVSLAIFHTWYLHSWDSSQVKCKRIKPKICDSVPALCFSVWFLIESFNILIILLSQIKLAVFQLHSSFRYNAIPGNKRIMLWEIYFNILNIWQYFFPMGSWTRVACLDHCLQNSCILVNPQIWDWRE